MTAAERLASEAERLATLVAALEKAARLVPEPPAPVAPPAPVVVQPPQPSAEERLRDFAQRHAFFFANGTEFVAEPDTARTLDEAAALIQAADEASVIRVVGYTDSQGGQQQNNAIALSRAQRVADELAARGVARDRLVVVGRINGYFEVSPTTGTASPNRRVELEVGFRGERRSSP